MFAERYWSSEVKNMFYKIPRCLYGQREVIENHMHFSYALSFVYTNAIIIVRGVVRKVIVSTFGRIGSYWF